MVQFDICTERHAIDAILVEEPGATLSAVVVATAHRIKRVSRLRRVAPVGARSGRSATAARSTAGRPFVKNRAEQCFRSWRVFVAELCSEYRGHPNWKRAAALSVSGK